MTTEHVAVRRPRLARGLCLGVLGAVLAPGLAPALPPASLPEPPTSRICCAFGYSLEPRIAGEDTPIRLGNVGSETTVGSHSYDGANRLYERNGLVYTCRGGFVDIAHVRDYADWTAFLVPVVRDHLGTGRSYVLPAEGGERRLRFMARSIPDATRDGVALTVARRIAFELSIWHEVSSWYGYTLVPIFPERLSSFSPEDVYSNAIGTAVGADAYSSPRGFDEAVEHAIDEMLERLDAVSKRDTLAALRQVDGSWWDSGRAMPDTDLVLRRNMDIGPVLEPWRVPDSQAVGCKGLPSAAQQSVPAATDDGEPLNGYFRLEILPDRSTLPTLPEDVELPAVITSSDLAWLTAGVRESMRAAGLATSLDAPSLVRPLAAASEVSEIEVRAAVRGGCGPLDPDCAAGLERLLAGFHLLETELVGGFTVDDETTGVGGGTITVLGADTRGGDLSAFVFDVHDDRDRRDVIAQFTVARSDVLFFCEDAETGELQMPIEAWFRPCRPGSRFGLGGSLGTFQYDGATGRSAIRPFSLDVVFDPLASGHTPALLDRRLLLFAGFELSSVFPGDVNRSSVDAEVSPRFGLGARGRVRSPGRRLELQGFALVRQDLSESDDVMAEIGAKLYYHLVSGQPDLYVSPEGETPRPAAFGPWGLLRLGVETGVTYWSEPENSIAEWVGPFVSDREKTSFQLLFSVGFRPGSLTF